jgi:hypothetical protein
VTDSRRIVESGYDSSARRYLAWSARIADDPRYRLFKKSLKATMRDLDALMVAFRDLATCRLHRQPHPPRNHGLRSDT